jgi:hypothetical protein
MQDLDHWAGTGFVLGDNAEHRLPLDISQGLFRHSIWSGTSGSRPSNPLS